MPDPRPELILVGGPATGLRAVLMDDSAVVGRGVDCDVKILDETVSRRHLLFRLAPGGWVVENVSKFPIRINGKKYGKGRKAFVETGDVLRLGMLTDVLFVSPGDDPEQVLRAYRLEHPELPPTGPTGAAVEAEEAPEPTVVTAVGQSSASAATDVDAEADALDEEALEQKRKMRKYVIMGGAYLLILVVVFGLLFVMKKDDEPVQRGFPSLLSEAEIQRALDPAVDARGDNPVAAQENLEQSRKFYLARQDSIGNLYRCVKFYRWHEAYRGDRIPAVQDEQMYDRAVEELTERVVDTYKNAYALSKDRQWAHAELAFREIQDLVPAKERPMLTESNDLWDNVQEHLTYIGQQLEDRSRRR